MGFFNFGKKEPIKTVEIPANKAFSYVASFAQCHISESPQICERKGKDWIYFGEDNLWPQHLKKIVMQSPTQGAIIKSKSGMMSGDGIMVNGAKSKQESDAILQALPLNVQADFASFMDNSNNECDIEEIVAKISWDFEMFGAFALEVVWSMDFTRIATIKYIDVANIRSGKMVGNKVEKYYYSRDWSQSNKEEYKPQEIAAFNQSSQSYNQLIYVKTGNLEYYGEPSYIQGITYIDMEGKIANFHINNITNGFAPNMAMKFYELPGSPEQERDFVRSIEKRYSGTGNAGRAMIFFSDGKELAPDVTPVPVSDLHEQFIAVNDLAVQNILTANQVTSPLLFGISTSGKLGGSTELGTAYQIFNSSVIEPDRKKVEKTLNKLLALNEIPVEISILPFNPLLDNTVTDSGNTTVNALNSLSPLVATKVLEMMTNDEIRNIIGLAPTNQIPDVETPAVEPA